MNPATYFIVPQLTLIVKLASQQVRHSGSCAALYRRHLQCVALRADLAVPADFAKQGKISILIVPRR